MVSDVSMLRKSPRPPWNGMAVFAARLPAFWRRYSGAERRSSAVQVYTVVARSSWQRPSKKYRRTVGAGDDSRPGQICTGSRHHLWPAGMMVSAAGKLWGENGNGRG